MIEVRFHPLPVWPYPATPAYSRRGRWTFKASWQSTLSLLDRELHQLGASDVVIECGLRPHEIRGDGWPRSNANQPQHPGCALHFDTRNLGHLRYATDVHEFWQHNIRAIALGLEALRKVDRYGITSGGEQYRGFGELPPGTLAMPAAKKMTIEEAARFIAEHATDDGGWQRFDSDDVDGPWLKDAYRLAAKRLHPDNGGDPALFQQLQDAKRLLEGAA